MNLLRSLSTTFVALPLLAACNFLGNSAGQISERIGAIANDPASRELDLSRQMSFGWDRVYFFKPGTPRSEICDFLEAKPEPCARVIRYEAVPADHTAMLYTLRQQLTHTELHAHANGVFDVEAGPEGLPKSACVFKVTHVASTGPVPIARLSLK